MIVTGLIAGKRGITVLSLVLFVAGTYSTGSGLYIQAKAHVAQHLLERAWHLHQLTGNAQKPWPWADIRAFARLSVDATNAKYIVLDDANPEALAFGPGWISGSARHPAHGTVALGGHRDTHLAFLETTNMGDVFNLETADGQSFRYRVTARRVVDTLAEPLTIDLEQQALVLITCYPFDALQPGSTLRLVVTAQPMAAALMGPDPGTST